MKIPLRVFFPAEEIKLSLSLKKKILNLKGIQRIVLKKMRVKYLVKKSRKDGMVIWMKGTVVERQRSGCTPDTFESRVKKKGGVNLGVKHKAKGCSLIVGIRT